MSYYDADRDIDYLQDASDEYKMRELGGFYRLVIDFDDRDGHDPAFRGHPLDSDNMEDAVDEALDWLSIDSADNFLWVYLENDDKVHFALSTDPVVKGESDWPEDATICGSVRFTDV